MKTRAHHARKKRGDNSLFASEGYKQKIEKEGGVNSLFASDEYKQKIEVFLCCSEKSLDLFPCSRRESAHKVLDVAVLRGIGAEAVWPLSFALARLVKYCVNSFMSAS